MLLNIRRFSTNQGYNDAMTQTQQEIVGNWSNSAIMVIMSDIPRSVIFAAAAERYA